MSASVLVQPLSSSNHSELVSESPSPSTICDEQLRPFINISVIKVLNKAKFPVYLINNTSNKQNYAMKVFPFASNKPHPYFQNEARFSFLDHPNVIKTHHIEKERDTICRGTSKKASYTIMEFAPNGDFFDLLTKYNAHLDDKLIRTYFRQLIEGLEYLHNSGVAHMDLKLENLLVGEDFKLKIADFDLSYVTGDSNILSKGTKFYRAPELIQGRCQDPKSVDIYSAGIILFTMKTGGVLPHAEDSLVSGVDFAGLLYTENHRFYRKHCEIQKRPAGFFEDDFKDLFHALIAVNPKHRSTLSEIKKTKWYNGPYYTDEELKSFVGGLYGVSE